MLCEGIQLSKGTLSWVLMGWATTPSIHPETHRTICLFTHHALSLSHSPDCPLNSGPIHSPNFLTSPAISPSSVLLIHPPVHLTNNCGSPVTCQGQFQTLERQHEDNTPCSKGLGVKGMPSCEDKLQKLQHPQTFTRVTHGNKDSQELRTRPSAQPPTDT